MFEILNSAFVFFCPCPRAEGSEVLALSGLRIRFARIEPVLTGLQLSDHYDLPQIANLEDAHRLDYAVLKTSGW